MASQEVWQAGEIEMHHFKSNSVHWKILDATGRGIPVLPTRWVVMTRETNKHAVIEAELSLRKNMTQTTNGFHAPTPPLQAWELLVTDAVTLERDSPKEETQRRHRRETRLGGKGDFQRKGLSRKGGE